jgi:hypothetical protein
MASIVLAASVVVAITWLLEHVMPPPYSGYLALAIVGVAATEIFKRRPRQRALRMFRYYLRARQRGADEPAARAHLIARLYRHQATRARMAGTLEARWAGDSEKARTMGGVDALLTAESKRIDGDALSAVYDRVRDQFMIPGWEALPQEFVSAVGDRLDAHDREQLDALAARYRLFHQRFFRVASALGTDPATSVVDFARLLHSMGNGLAKEAPGDAERAYRLSLRLRPDRNLAHAGLALLLEQTGRTREAAREAQTALKVLDEYAGRAAADAPSTEDISPFRSPKTLREALQRVAAAG